jgi:hypothetical protein
MAGIAHLMNKQFRAQFGRPLNRARHRLFWYVTRNPPSRRQFSHRPPHLTEPGRRLLDDLHQTGIGIIDGKQFGLDPVKLDELATIVETFAGSSRIQEGIAHFGQLAGQHTLKGDDYIIKLFAAEPSLAVSHPLLQLALDQMLEVVNSYLGLWAKLIYADVWHTIPMDPGWRVGSQAWHRDPEDRRMIKAYLYFSEVDASAGPMEYVIGSADGAKYGPVFRWKPQAPRQHRYPPTEEFERHFAGAERVSCVGSPGTLILCDTIGFHRGGIATGRPRILATWTFVTPASLGSLSRRRFSLSSSEGLQQLSPAARFALD